MYGGVALAAITTGDVIELVEGLYKYLVNLVISFSYASCKLCGTLILYGLILSGKVSLKSKLIASIPFIPSHELDTNTSIPIISKKFITGIIQH